MFIEGVVRGEVLIVKWISLTLEANFYAYLHAAVKLHRRYIGADAGVPDKQLLSTCRQEDQSLQEAMAHQAIFQVD